MSEARETKAGNEHRAGVRKKVLLVLVRATVITAASIAFILFAGGRMNDTAEELVVARNELAVFSKKQSLLDTMGHDAEVATRITARVANTFPSEDNVTVVADYISGLGTKLNVTTDVQFGFVTEGSAPFEELPFSMRISGTHDTVLTMLSALETGPYFIAVRSVSLTYSDVPGLVETHITGAALLKKP
ncbi:MAG: hypothetical protein AAB581_04035 [Patescibacteria group bacterium]|mgnify:CR=1 FL=1